MVKTLIRRVVAKAALACGIFGYSIKPEDLAPVETPRVEVVACGGDRDKDPLLETAKLEAALTNYIATNIDDLFSQNDCYQEDYSKSLKTGVISA